MNMRLLAPALLAAVLIGGCASFPSSVTPGTARAQVLANLGAPTATHALASGTRLQYSLQPLGRQVYNIDLDAAGRVLSVEQVMAQKPFERVQADVWKSTDLLREFGRPAEITRVSEFKGDVWTWRFLELNNPRFFHAYVDGQGVVRRWVTMDEFFNTPKVD